MAAVVNIICRHGLSIYNQPNKNKLAPYKLLNHIYSRLKQFYIHNKRYRYTLVTKDGCCVFGHHMCIDVFKMSWLGLQIMNLG